MNGRSIFLVEDNPDDVELTRRALRQAKVANRFILAKDGVEALEKLLADGPARVIPEVVLLDLKLPRLGGIEILKRIRQNPRTALLPVVILTSSQEEQDLVASYRLGANSYIRKPIDFVQFVEAVRELGVYWLALNVTPPPGCDRPRPVEERPPCPGP